MEKAISYIRVSTNGQESGTSLENQRNQIQKYADLKGFNIIGTIEDTKSAKNLKRPGMQTVLKMATQKEIDHVIISKLDRGFRSVSDALDTAKKLDKHGIGLHSVSEMIDTKSAMGKFFFVIMAGAAELERNRLSERLTEAFAYKRSKGEKMGRWIRYGYDLKTDGKTLKKNPKEQRIIRKIISLRNISKKSLTDICRYLNHKNVPTKTGKKWNLQQIRNILRYEEVNHGTS